MSVLNLVFIKTCLPKKPRLNRAFLLPAFNCAVMGFAAWLVYPAFLGLLGAGPQPDRFTTMVAMLGTIAVAALVYLILTIATRAITLDDMKLIPKGERIAKLLRIR
jgi:stage V sporulation protein B